MRFSSRAACCAACVASVLYLTAACAARQGAAGGQSSSAARLPSDSVRWTGVLAPPPNASGLINGSVTLMVGDRPGRIRALLSIRNGTMGASYPWEIQSGLCGEQGTPLGSPTSFTPLFVGADGTSQVNTLISATLPMEGRYHVNVYRARSERDRVIACGNLNLERTG